MRSTTATSPLGDREAKCEIRAESIAAALHVARWSSREREPDSQVQVSGRWIVSEWHTSQPGNLLDSGDGFTEREMKILLAHNRYRSGAPSGENRVVEQESAALAALGHEVSRFETAAAMRSSMVCGQEGHVAGADRVEPGHLPRHEGGHCVRNVPDVVHVHNTFPLISAACALCLPGCWNPPGGHPPQLPAGLCQRRVFSETGLSATTAQAASSSLAFRHGCYRDSVAATVPRRAAMMAHRRAWRSLVSAYIFISESQRDLLRRDPLAR